MNRRIEQAFHGAKGGTVFVDELRHCVRNRNWRHAESCHLYTLPGWESDLHEFAGKLGLKRGWYQENAVMPHYDLTASKRQMAVALGAIDSTPGEVLDCIRSWRHARALTRETSLAAQRGEVLAARIEGGVNSPCAPEEVSATVAECLARISNFPSERPVIFRRSC